MKVEELPEPLRAAVDRWLQRVNRGWAPSEEGMSVFEPDLITLARALLRELNLPTEPRLIPRLDTRRKH